MASDGGGRPAIGRPVGGASRGADPRPRGTEAFYGWGSGDNRVEGASINLAMVLFHAYGNAVVEAGPVQETAEAWYFTHSFVDHERNTSVTRQFRQSKREVVHGKMDAERKDQVRFGKGQSKSIRNVILTAVPQYLITKAIEVAKQGARAKIDNFIKEKGLSAAQAYTVSQLKRVGVSEEAVLAKMGKAKIDGLDLDDLVDLSSDFKAIDAGEETAAALFDLAKPGAGKLDLKGKLQEKVDAGKQPDPEAKAVEQLPVTLGKEPFSWIVSDAGKDHKVRDENGGKRCNCPVGGNGQCAHVLATERFIAMP